jgi:hypothetical protein
MAAAALVKERRWVKQTKRVAEQLLLAIKDWEKFDAKRKRKAKAVHGGSSTQSEARQEGGY